MRVHLSATGSWYTTQVYEGLLDAIAAAKAQYREVARGDTLALGSLRFQVLSPAATDPAGDINDGSLVLRLVYGPTSFLFTGDAQAHAEQAMLAAGQPVQATILKMGHHGSATSSSLAFLQQVQPRVAVYSAGVGNPYGHPAPATLAHLAALGAATYGTDVNGTVLVSADAQGYRVLTEHGNGPRGPPAPAPTLERVTVTPGPPAAASASPGPPPPASRTPAGSPSSVATLTAPVPTTPTVTVSGLPLALVSLTTPARRNGRATLVLQTAPGATCTIDVIYKSGSSRAAGLGPQVADAAGRVTWSWLVGGRTTVGTWRIVVTARAGGATTTQELPFQVIR